MPEVNWDLATSGPDYRDHLDGCPAAESEDECICAEIEKDLGAYYADNAYEYQRDKEMEARR